MLNDEGTVMPVTAPRSCDTAQAMAMLSSLRGRVLALRYPWATRHDLGLARAAIDHLLALGLLESWRLSRRTYYVLTPWAAEQLGLTLDERWEKSQGCWIETPYWVPLDEASTVARIKTQRPRSHALDRGQFAAPSTDPAPALPTDPRPGGILTLFNRPVTIDRRMAQKRVDRPCRSQTA